MRNALPCITASVSKTTKPATLSTSPTPCVMLFTSSSASFRIGLSRAIFVLQLYSSRSQRNKQSYLWIAFIHRKMCGGTDAALKLGRDNREVFVRRKLQPPQCGIAFDFVAAIPLLRDGRLWEGRRPAGS